MKRHHLEHGSALVAAIIVVGVVVFIAGTVLMTAIPAYRSTYHAAAWQEAKLAADAGIDLAIAEIQKTTKDPNTYPWTGWTLANGDPIPNKSNDIRILVPSTDLLFNSGDGSTRPQIMRVEVDVITRDDNVSKNPVYRIRSTGSAEINSSQLGLDKRDAFLRRISLLRNRVTRTVEVITRPVYLWEYALKTKGSMVLGGGTSWIIDSYDSRYTFANDEHRGSLGGMYNVAFSGEFGNIASNQMRPANSPYGVLIDAEGARVRGEVQTHGGDNPNTTDVHENVEESQNIDPKRITNEFEEDLLNPQDPMALPSANPVRYVTEPWVTAGPKDNKGNDTKIVASDVITNPPLTSPIPTYSGTLGGSNERGNDVRNPVRVLLQPGGNKSQGGFTVAPSPNGSPRYVEIYMDASMDLNGSTIVIPPNVYVKLFVNGNLNFKNQDLNYSSDSSRKPANLEMYGVATPTTSYTPRVDSSGNGHIVGVFYGPQYAGNLDGNTEIIGGFVLNTYNIAGGGGSGGDSVGAGFHYDEALGVTGPIQSYRVMSYFEDFRKDLD